MLYEMNKKSDEKDIAKYGKAQGTVLVKKLLPDISRTKNLFIIDSYEEFKKIEDKLLEDTFVNAVKYAYKVFQDIKS